MDFSMSIFVFPLLLISFFVAAFIYYQFLNKKLIPERTFRPAKWSDAQANVALSKYFPYYQELDAQNKLRFLSRVKEFVQIKTFIPRQTAPNETINLLIAATAIQLTFGLDDFSLYSFDKILIYPDTYYSEIRNNYHKGEINVPHRLIVLAASHFLSGVRDPNDGINLGLHEIAHALNVHTFEEGNNILIEKFRCWSDEALVEIDRIKLSQTNFIRKYAATNLEEMFAVCSENFFERPEQFSKEIPNLYQKMMDLFNQDPRNHASPILVEIRC